MPSLVPTDVSTQLHMSLDDIISKDGAKTGAPTGRPPAAKAQLDRRNCHDRRGRGMFNVPRGIVKQRSSSFSASTYGLDLVQAHVSTLYKHLRPGCLSFTCRHRQLMCKNMWVLMWRLLRRLSASNAGTHPPRGTLSVIAVCAGDQKTTKHSSSSR